MSESLRVALIVSTYNWPEALEAVLLSIKNQSVQPNEIFIADDGSGDSTESVIATFKNTCLPNLEHIWQQDLGFRKTIVVNRAIASSLSDYIIQIDGDMVLHRHFIKDHIAVAERSFYVKGSRILFDEGRTEVYLKDKRSRIISPLSNGIRNRFNAVRSRLLSHFLERKSKRSADLRGCNFAAWKTDLFSVNGYDNGLSGWGHEDIELAARLVNSGIMQKRIKNYALAYHLHHKLNERFSEDINYQTYLNTVESGKTTCEDGIRIL